MVPCGMVARETTECPRCETERRMRLCDAAFVTLVAASFAAFIPAAQAGQHAAPGGPYWFWRFVLLPTALAFAGAALGIVSNRLERAAAAPLPPPADPLVPYRGGPVGGCPRHPSARP